MLVGVAEFLEDDEDDDGSYDEGGSEGEGNKSGPGEIRSTLNLGRGEAATAKKNDGNKKNNAFACLDPLLAMVWEKEAKEQREREINLEYRREKDQRRFMATTLSGNNASGNNGGGDNGGSRNGSA